MTSPVAPIEVDLDAILALPEHERQEELARLADLNSRIERNPQYRFMPHAGELQYKLEHGLPVDGTESRGQVEFLEAGMTTDVVAAVAGNRFGKTHIGAEDGLIQTLPPEFIPPWLMKYRHRDDSREFYLRAVGVDLGNWLEKALLPKLRKLIPPAALWKGDFDKAYTERTRKLQFADGSWWDFLTHDMDIDSFASADLDAVWFDEEPPGEKGKQQVDESYGRLADRDGYVRWTLTPLLGLSHVYYELTDDQGNPRQDEDVWVVVGDIDHNPHISERGRRKFLKRFEGDPLKLQARKSGRWVHFAGRVYDEFAEAEPPRGHVIPPRPIPRKHEGAKPEVPIFASIDPGIATDHPAALVMAWLNPDDVLEVFHAHRIYGGTVEDMAKHYHAVQASGDAGGKFDVRWTTIDPSARNKHHATGKSSQGEYRKHKVSTIPGQNDVQAGINAVKERLRSGRLVIHADCTELIEELRDYRWKGNKRSSSEDAAKPQVIKKKDDLADALRYLVMQLPRPKQPADVDEREVEKDLPPGEQAFRQQLRRLGRRRGRKRPSRIGGVI